jgi:hypothetical protein
MMMYVNNFMIISRCFGNDGEIEEASNNSFFFFDVEFSVHVRCVCDECEFQP